MVNGTKKAKMFEMCGYGYGNHYRGEEEEEREIELRDDGSFYSLTGVLLPPLGATALNNGSRRPKLRGYIISPYNRHYKIWNKFLVLLVFYTAWMCPFEFGFLEKSSEVVSVTDNVVNGLFGIDIMLTFFVAYLDKSTYLLVDDHKLIAMRYAKSWLVLDVIASIPYELVIRILPESLRFYSYFNILRLWRLRRVSAMFARLEKDKSYSYFWVRCVKLICVTLFSVHAAACFFYFLAAREDPKTTWLGLVPDAIDQSLWGYYTVAIYWAIVTLVSTGYGDLHPVNTKEMAFDIIYMFFNLWLTSYLIGNMTNMVVHWTERTKNYRDTVQSVSNFANRNHLPTRLQEQIYGHLLMKYRTDLEGLQHQEIIDSLPRAILSSISHYLFFSVVDKVYLFSGVSNDLLFQLVTEMKAEYFPPKEDVILQNEAPTDFYIIISGVADLILKRNGIEQVVGELKQGDVFGETGVLCYRPQVFTVRTKRLSQILRLSRTTFLSLTQSNVGDGTMIMNNFLQHLHESGDSVMREILSETEAMLARGRMDLPISVVFAVSRGDEVLLHQLLKKGTDPNEPDRNGKTALHIAASRGKDRCVAMLLENGANPNIKDLEGNLPVWEAIKAGHGISMRLLIENGATMSPSETISSACNAVEKNNMEILKGMVKCGLDLTGSTSNGTTPLHAAVCEGHVEIVRFLVESGACIDMPDASGLTPRFIAEQQCNEEILNIFKKGGHMRAPLDVPTSSSSFIGRSQSEPTPGFSHSKPPSEEELTWFDSHQRRRISPFHNSFFGIMSSANDRKYSTTTSQSSQTSREEILARVTLICPEKGEKAKKLVFMPNSIEELLRIGFEKFDFSPNKILSEEGAEIDDIFAIRDGDLLYLV